MLKYKSHHQHALVKKLGSFDEYIRWRCDNDIKFQKDFIYSANNKQLVNFVGRFEQLTTDFDFICSKIGIKVDLPTLNVSNTTPFQNYYTDTTAELVQSKFRPDIELFNYKFI